MLSAFGIILLFGGCCYFVLVGKGAVLEQWETDNGTFKIRVQRRPELFGVLPRYYYVFESRRLTSKRWSHITTLLLDDPLPIPRDQVRFLSSEIGYVFMSSTYAVTTDAGSKWFVFNARTDPPIGTPNSYWTIRDLQVAANGTGTMLLYSKMPAAEVVLKTKDYGRHWSTE